MMLAGPKGWRQWSVKQRFRLSLLIVCLFVAAWRWLGGDAPQLGDRRLLADGASWFATSPAAAATVDSGLQTGLEGLPSSLQGTQVDGQVRADSAGHLVLDRGVRNLFDYFLSLVGEEALSRVRARVLAYLSQHLPALAASEAQILFDSYVAYQAAQSQSAQDGAGAAPSSELSAAQLKQRLAMVNTLRQQYFSVPERAAFFEGDEQYDQYTIDRLLVLQDETLSALDKARRLGELSGRMPTVIEQYQALSTITAELQANGGSPQALHEVRVQLVGADAANRLAQLDGQRTQWTERVQSYMTQRAALLADPSLSALQRDESVTRLASTLFNERERLRLDAITGQSVPH